MPSSTVTLPADAALRQPRRNILDRFLSILADVKPGEGTGVILLAINVFVLLGSYYLLKTVREALILSEKGAEVKSYSGAGQALLLLLIVPAYGMIASKVNRIKLISWVTLFFMSHLVVFYLLGNGGAHVGIAFFLWVGIFNLLVVAQFWGFANDLYTEPEGKRLFPIIGVGASLGAWTGAEAASRVFHVLGPYNIMLIASGGLLLSILLSLISHRRESASDREKKAGKAQSPLGAKG